MRSAPHRSNDSAVARQWMAAISSFFALHTFERSARARIVNELAGVGVNGAQV